MSMGIVSGVIGAGTALYGAYNSSKAQKGGTQTVDKSPWEGAVPWLQNNLVEGQNLQNYYKQNPFSPQQQQAYSNLFGDLDQFRTNMAPALFNKAGEMMNSNYQRKSYDRPGMVGYSQGGGLLQPPAAQQANSSVFNIPQGGNYGLLNFAQSQPQAQAPTQQFDSATIEKLVKEELERIAQAKRDESLRIAGNAGDGY